jgi:leucyl aminopeptidase
MRRNTLIVSVASVLALAAVAPIEAEAQTGNYARAARAPAPQQRTVSFASELGAPGGSLVLPLGAEGDLETRGAALDADTRASIARAIASARFRYRARATLSLRGIGEWDRILVIGLGADPSMAGMQRTGAAAGRSLLEEPGAVSVLTTGMSAEHVAEFATGMGIGEYRSDLYQADAREAEPLGATSIVGDAASEASALYRGRGRALIDAMAFTRDLSNEPANVIYPESFVARTRAAFAGVPGVNIQVIDEAGMRRHGMGAILGVGQGSERPPRMLIVSYRGRGAPEGGPIVLAGKGITFDSGGISLKNPDGMGDMKMDMSGAASVVGAVLALSRAGAPVNVVAIAALAENMPDGGASRPGDVLTAMNGKTIEIGSTDAEGRLVLADAMSYADRHLNPAVVVDVATLTGSVRGALGDEYAGLFSRHDALADQLQAAGEIAGEELWRLPLHDSYGRDTSSQIADIRNGGGGGAGAGVGAYFIGEFISREIPWAHLDIANMAWTSANDWKPDGSAAFSLRLLERFVRDFQPVPRGAPAGAAETETDDED